MYDATLLSADIFWKSNKQRELKKKKIRDHALRLELHLLQTCQAHQRGKLHAQKLTKAFWMLGNEPILEMTLDHQAKLLEKFARTLEPYKLKEGSRSLTDRAPVTKDPGDAGSNPAASA